jgi:hypothetical protein
MGQQSSERRLLLGIRSGASRAEWEHLALELFEQLSGEGGRLLRASESSLVFDFPLSELGRLLLLLRRHSARGRLAMALGVGEVILLASAEALAHSISVDVERVEQAAGGTELGIVATEESLTPWLDSPPLSATPAAEVADRSGEDTLMIIERVSAAVSEGTPSEPGPALSRSFAGESAGDAIRRLKQDKVRARQTGAGGTHLCKLSLSLAIQLGRAGRHRDAAFEALEGLALARNVEDGAGERACAALLSQMAKAEGDSVSSDAWGRIAR